MTSSALQLLLLTCTDIGERSLFRAVRLDLSISPGQGRSWVDLSRDNGYEAGWQDHLRHLQSVGRAAFPLPWETTDLFLSPRGRGITLDGRSASLPLFVAWVALLAGRPLPAPFLATGVSQKGTDALTPAPREYLQGKLEVASAYVRQTQGETGVPVEVWVPAGSSYDLSSLQMLNVCEVETLPEAARRILGADLEETR